ncbi:quinoprotein dehydrogenase-associated SoxYZ-like carrier [Azospirillum thermophilum]|uniref:Quinoprotein dehydrogenase-associated SoxYZ-like carrier n=1 Tax=Azospirillum thermophilum TaxID=2202148 RepID=A0A2S2CXU5_9PROT|nr:quinoprotein dehydrogenase-associated SoxYZ-like carrier [Azospirillum thermophilum]AWK89342.1 quinoprotein dehydrogenase-associated SoxYZ-like carrier [Azospirillum thermophilum]
MAKRSGVGVALLLLLCGGAAGAAAASPEEERWELLHDMYYSGRTVEEAGPVLTIEAPKRAGDAALVPVRVASSPEGGVQVTALHLIIDNNPIPRAAVFRFPDSGPHAIETRVRVDAYTNVTAIAETADGRLLKTTRFVKAAGGCSAPALKNAEAALGRLGRMKLNLPEAMTAGQPVTAQLLISHPNYTGMQFDQVNRYVIPAHYVKSIAIRYNGAPVLEVESDISLSEDPSIHFTLVPEKSGTLEVTAEDTKGAVFRQSWPVHAASGS